MGSSPALVTPGNAPLCDDVAPLFETPRHRPEIIAGIGGSEADTYYQVMFASPDNLLFEVVYTGPKAA